MKFGTYFLIFFITLFLLISQTILSISYEDFTTPKTCSSTWGQTCNYGGSGGIDDAFDVGGITCDGREYNQSLTERYYVEEVYINASAFRPNSEINVKCQFKEGYR
jgi:hypothetical protein